MLPTQGPLYIFQSLKIWVDMDKAEISKKRCFSLSHVLFQAPPFFSFGGRRKNQTLPGYTKKLLRRLEGNVGIRQQQICSDYDFWGGAEAISSGEENFSNFNTKGDKHVTNPFFSSFFLQKTKYFQAACKRLHRCFINISRKLKSSLFERYKLKI